MVKQLKYLFLTLGTLLFAACSQGGDDDTTNGGGGFVPSPDVALSVEACPLQPMSGGTVTLQYHISSPVEGQMLETSKASASWISNIVIGSSSLSFDVASNYEAADAPREAWFDLLYGELEPVRVTVRQHSEPSIFDVSFSEITPEGAVVEVSTERTDVKYILLKATRQYIEQTGDLGYYALSYALLLHDYYGTDYLDSALHTGVYSEKLAWSENEVEPCVCVYGIVRANDEKRTPSLATSVYVVDAPLPAYPKIEVEKSSLDKFAATAGRATLEYSIVNPLEGRQATFSLSPEASSWVHNIELTSSSLSFDYDENTYSVERNGSIKLHYDYAMDVEITFAQRAASSGEQLTFDVEIKECHWDNIVVDCTPSNLSTKYIVSAISKAQFEKYPCYGDKANLPMYDLEYLYFKPTAVTGAQQSLRVSADIGYNNEFVDHYLYVYAVDESVTMATSEITLYEVKLVNDRPVIHFRNDAQISYSGSTPQIVVPATAAKYTVTFGIDNPYPAGHLVVSSYNDIFVKEEGSTRVKFEVDMQNNTITFWTVDNAKTKDVYGSIALQYYEDASSTSSKATATLSVLQRAKQ